MDNKNVRNSKHFIICDIFLRPSEHADIAEEQCKDTQAQVQSCLMQKVLWISSNLYENNVASSNDLSKGETRPIQFDAFSAQLFDDISRSSEMVLTKLKLNLIMYSQSIADEQVHIDDLVYIFIRLQNKKHEL